MKTLLDQLSAYAAYHRDPRNIFTHFIGIPMIVVAVAVLLSRPVMGSLAGMPITLALGVSLVTALYYLRLDLRFGLAMAVALGLSLWAGAAAASQTTAVWLAWGIGLFVVGWVIQFVGHHFEGRKPAFVDDVIGLIIGPLFVVAEAAFLLGWRSDLRQAIEARAGPVRRRLPGGQQA